MGAWDELDTEITIELDCSDIDAAIEMSDPIGLYDETKEHFQDLKKCFEKGCDDALEQLGMVNITQQEIFINQNCKNPSGMLASSITAESNGEHSILIGTRINHIYPMSVEYGRGPVYPIRAKALAFYVDTGELVFRKSAGPAKPRPFVEPAFDKTMEAIDRIIDDNLAQALMDFD